ncbi:uncharacterized protein LOC129600878 [Paramacrobiotus metropolitanus]|uniref:uncharacterized protein LOC129600878 n=1 Tax=Paramacrobiotus metropolitanus TaxID=2943436 RepID=UPI002445DA74|nr:uncharacterized protein LOC129600878 [Paramacrobiotus metropolitanus]
MSNPKENEYARKFNTDYSRRLTSNAPYSLRHSGQDKSQPSSTDSTKSVEAREKRNERILLADSNPTSDDSFEDAHDKTFLEPKADLAAPSHPTGGESEKLQAETTLSHAEAEHPHGVPTSLDSTEGPQLSSQKAQESVTTMKVTDSGRKSPNQTDNAKKSTSPNSEKIEDVNRLRKRCQDLITQIVLADQIVNSTESQMSRSEDTHKLERRRWEKELAEANNGIAAQQRRIEHLESHLKRSDNPCRYDFEEVGRLRSTLATSVESVFELKRRLATVEKDLADTQTALVESELAAGTFHQQFNQANEEAEVYRNEVDRYIVELKQADDEVDRQRHRIEQLETEMEILLARAGRQLMAHYSQQPASPDRSRAITDLEQANAQLVDQVYGLNDVLKEEQRLRAQLEHSLAEAQKVYEAQQNRITHLEIRENDLYNYGLDADKYIDDLNRYIDEMTKYTDDLDTEVRCLQEETKHLEQSRTDPPSYRTSMATDFHFEPSQTVRDILWDIQPKEQKKEPNFFVGVVTNNPLTGTPPQQQPLPHRPEPERNTSTAAPHVPTSNVPTTTTATLDQQGRGYAEQGWEANPPPPPAMDAQQAANRAFQETMIRVCARGRKQKLPEYDGDHNKLEGWLKQIRRFYAEAQEWHESDHTFMTDLISRLEGQAAQWHRDTAGSEPAGGWPVNLWLAKFEERFGDKNKEINAVTAMAKRKYRFGQETPEQYYDAMMNIKSRCDTITDQMALFHLKDNIHEPKLREALEIRMPATPVELRDYIRQFVNGKEMYDVVKGSRDTDYARVRATTPTPAPLPQAPVQTVYQPYMMPGYQSPPATYVQPTVPMTPPAQMAPVQQPTWAGVAAVNVAAPQPVAGAPTNNYGGPSPGSGGNQNNGNSGYNQNPNQGYPAYGQNPTQGFGGGGYGRGKGRGGGNRGRGNRGGGGNQQGNRPPQAQQGARQYMTYVDKMEQLFLQWTLADSFTCHFCKFGNHPQARCAFIGTRVQDNPNRRWYEDWHTRYLTGGPLGSANPNSAQIVPPPRQRQQGGGSGGAGNGNQQAGSGNGSTGNRRNSGGGQQGSPEQRQMLPPHQPFGSPSPNNGPARGNSSGNA